MRSLTVKLVLAFLIVSLTGAALSAAFTRWATNKEFDRMVLDKAEADLITAADRLLPGAQLLEQRHEQYHAAPPPDHPGNPAARWAGTIGRRRTTTARGAFLGVYLIDQNRARGDHRPAIIRSVTPCLPVSLIGKDTAIEIDGQSRRHSAIDGEAAHPGSREGAVFVRTDQALLLSRLISTFRERWSWASC